MPKDFTNQHEYIFAEIDNKAPEWVQLMRTIKAEHGVYGAVKLDTKDLQAFKKNFDEKKRRVELAVDYSHMAHLEAAGWITNIELREQDTELWIQVDWTDEAKKKIQDKQYRYLSADFSMKYIDEETNEVIGQMLHGAGLTNRPFIRGMNPILSEINDVELSNEQICKIRGIIHGKDEQPNEKDIVMNFKELLEAVKNLSNEEKTQLSEAIGVAPKSNDESDKQLSEANQKVKDLEEEKKKLSEEKEKLEQERKFDALLSEGKVVEAQREPFLANDMEKFASLKEDVNLSEAGSEGGEGAEDEPKTPEDAANKLSEIADALVEKEGLEFSDAMSRAIHENEKLYELSQKAA
jgi:hypothetical protein